MRLRKLKGQRGNGVFYGDIRYDVDFWRPYLVEILKRHGLSNSGQEPVAGVGSTYPAFLCGDVVVKLFGYRRWWREAHAAELFAV